MPITETVLKKIALAVFLASTTPAMAGDLPGDVESWVRESYAPLWPDEPWNSLEQLLSHYDKNVTIYSAEGGISVKLANNWLGDALDTWRDDGWAGSDMTSLHTHPINQTTIAFIMQWKDRYRDSPDEFSCGWYLANQIEGNWKFTAYADSVCAEE